MAQPRCVAWTLPEQAPVLARAISRAGLVLVGAGSPDPARTGQVAGLLGCDPIDDLRHALTLTEADLMILGDPGSFGELARDADLESLRAAQARNMCVTTLEPIPAAAGEIAGTAFADALHQGLLGDLASFVPLTRHTPMIRELYTVLETFAPVRACSITLGAPGTLGSLGAHLFDAMDLVRSLVGVPNIIEAAYISPSAGRGLHPLPGQSLRGLHGEITMNLRFPDGRCASLMLSDQLTATRTSMTLIGREGHIIVGLDGFEWFDRDGRVIDTHTCPDTGGVDPAELALSSQLIDLCSGVIPKRTPIDYTGVLSMTHATLLSTRTGQGESPYDVENLLLSM